MRMRALRSGSQVGPGRELAPEPLSAGNGPSSTRTPAAPSVQSAAVDKPTGQARPDWLEHSEGFQVFGPNGRIGFVARVVSSDQGVDELVIRTGLFRTRSMYVPVHKVGSIIARRQQLQLLTTPRVPWASPSDFVRELFGPAGERFPLQRADAARLPRTRPNSANGRDQIGENVGTTERAPHPTRRRVTKEKWY